MTPVTAIHVETTRVASLAHPGQQQVLAAEAAVSITGKNVTDIRMALILIAGNMAFRAANSDHSFSGYLCLLRLRTDLRRHFYGSKVSTDRWIP